MVLLRSKKKKKSVAEAKDFYLERRSYDLRKIV